MPTYDYECRVCGPFTEPRPMAECANPCKCPDCGALAPRVILSAPYFSLMDAATRTANTRNEKSANEPAQASAPGKHGTGCGCCSGKKNGKLLRRPDGSKTFPAARPWMISH